MKRELHADHIDTSGAYAQRYKIIQELFESGQISEIPKEFAESVVGKDDKFDANDEPIGYTPIKESLGWKLLTEHLGRYGGSGGITSSGFD
jgi:hypothetical protein